jgi:hypothetical protein
MSGSDWAVVDDALKACGQDCLVRCVVVVNDGPVMFMKRGADGRKRVRRGRVVRALDFHANRPDNPRSSRATAVTASCLLLPRAISRAWR